MSFLSKMAAIHDKLCYYISISSCVLGSKSIWLWISARWIGSVPVPVGILFTIDLTGFMFNSLSLLTWWGQVYWYFVMADYDTFTQKKILVDRVLVKYRIASLHVLVFRSRLRYL
jgi:hypothetical protein